MNQVMLRRDDFKVCLMALLESCAGWKGMIEEGELPDSITPEFARDLLARYTEVSDKIRAIVEMEPNSLSGEEYERIKGIVEGKV